MKTVPLPLPERQAKAVREAAKRSGLSQADVMRQSISIGLPVFLERICPNSDYLHPAPLPPGAMQRTWALREKDEPGVEQRAARGLRRRLARALQGKKATDL